MTSLNSSSQAVSVTVLFFSTFEYFVLYYAQSTAILSNCKGQKEQGLYPV